MKNICFVAGEKRKLSSLLPPLFFPTHPVSHRYQPTSDTASAWGAMPNNCSFWPRHWLSGHCISSPVRRQTQCWVPIRGRGCQQTHLSQVVKVVLVVHPLVVGRHAVGTVGDVPDVNPQAVVELALEKLQEGSDPIRVAFPTGFPTGFPMLTGMYRSCQDAARPARLQAT